MNNTTILIKRSLTTDTPDGLHFGELAYSYSSNTLFIGDTTNTSIEIAGSDVYDTITSASSDSIPDTLVKRDSTGSANFRTIIANTVISDARNISISGGDLSSNVVSFNGTSDIVLEANLREIPGLVSGSVGDVQSINIGTEIEVPVIDYGANGRILAVRSIPAIIPTIQTYTVSMESLDWVIQHNQGTVNFITHIKDKYNNIIIAPIEVINNNEFIIHFTCLESGSVSVLFGV